MTAQATHDNANGEICNPPAPPAAAAATGRAIWASGTDWGGVRDDQRVHSRQRKR